MDAVKIEVTRERAAGSGWANVDAIVSDVYAYHASDAFDLVYCRNLLQHLSRPVELLREMWRGVRIGGALVVEDADFEGSFCYPPNDGFEFWLTRYPQVLRSYAGDPLSGRKLPALFADAGIPPPHIAVVQRVDLTGEGKTMPMLTVQATATAMLEAGIATQEEISKAVDQLQAFAADDTTLHGSPRLFQAWTRRTRR